MKYEFEVLKVDDADAIFIRHYIDEKPYVILIDAGNVCDSQNIKNHLLNNYGSTIDLAICTHPDKDHKGGFFELLNDKSLTINEFWLTDPAHYLSSDDLIQSSDKEKAIKAVQKIYNHPNDENLNLIQLALSKCENVYSVVKGDKHELLPITIIGPTSEYYQEVVKDMVKEYGVNTYEECDTEKYDEAAKVKEEDAKSIIDEDDDPSPFNKSSLIILYEPVKGEHFVFAGDATCASLTQVLLDYPYLRNIDFLKVPHHGSKHNLNTTIIDSLSPKSCCISAKGTRKHPSPAIVSYLSKYGDVYSTHKSNSFIRRSRGISRNNTMSINPLKSKQK